MERVGSLTVICGPMFAGKTTKLLNYFTNADECVVIKPNFDDRYSKNEVVTHNGVKMPCYTVRRCDEWELMRFADTKKRVLIDEVQFMDPLVLSAVKLLLENGVDVYAAGLDMDYKGEPFVTTCMLMGIADRILKFNSICTKCGEPASRSYRKDKSVLSTFVLGSEELCVDCFMKYTKKGVDLSEND